MLFIIIIIFYFTSSFPDQGLHPSEQASRLCRVLLGSWLHGTAGGGKAVCTEQTTSVVLGFH